MKRILVTGSRALADRKLVHGALVQVLREWFGAPTDADRMPWLDKVVIVHGGQPTGVDRHAQDYAIVNFIDDEIFPIKRVHGSRGRLMRNLEMVTAGADVCLYFPGSDSDSTAELAHQRGIPVRVYRSAK